MRSGADILCDALHALDVRCVFGLPGTQNLALYEALRRSRIRAVLATSELAASFMANGYYRASGRVAPIVTIPGPGFTYALTGLAEARHDSAAVIHIVGAPEQSQRPFPFQAIDQRAIAAPLVKKVIRVDRADQMAAAAAEAMKEALSGEPGPVLLEASNQALDREARARVEGPVAPAPEECDPALLAEVVRAAATARRPVILAGQGCAGAPELLRVVAERLHAPVATTASARGVLPEDHPLALGFDFAWSDVAALNELASEADLVLALGCKLTAAGTGGYALSLPRDRLVHVDASAQVAGATYPARLALVARVEQVLARLAADLREPAPASTWEAEAVGAWRRRLERSRQGSEAEPAVDGARAGTSHRVFAALRRALPRDGILVTDSGLHAFLARRDFPVWAPRGLLQPSDFQSMGFGLPAAIGAKLAAPERRVVAVIGDGGFAMGGLELLTALRERVPITLVVFNDGSLNRIRLEQMRRFGRTTNTEILNPDFGAIAAALGVDYLRFTQDGDDDLRRAIDNEHPTLVEVLLADGPGTWAARAAGLVRGAARRSLSSRARDWLKERL